MSIINHNSSQVHIMTDFFSQFKNGIYFMPAVTNIYWKYNLVWTELENLLEGFKETVVRQISPDLSILKDI